MNNASRKDVLVQYLYNTYILVRHNRGLINYKDTKTKCRLLIEFFQTGDTVSHIGIFDPAL